MDEHKEIHAKHAAKESTESIAQESVNCPESAAELANRYASLIAAVKRATADYQNLKRDVERDKTDYVKFANERLLGDLLPAIDQYALVVRHIPDLAALPEAERKIWDNWLVGVRAVQSLWEQTAKSIGLERIATEGTFDPSKHDAASEEEAEGKPSGTIIRVIQDGWQLHGKVLRPARVVVAK